jgi:cytochrome c556
MRRSLVTSVAVVLLATAGIGAGRIDMRGAVEARRDNFDALLEAYKSVRGQLHQSSPNLRIVREGASRLAAMSHQLTTWFPVGSGPEAGADTKAKPAIWLQPADFRARAMTSLAAVDRLNSLAAGTDVPAMRAQQQAVAQACNDCHRVYEDGF